MLKKWEWEEFMHNKQNEPSGQNRQTGNTLWRMIQSLVVSLFIVFMLSTGAGYLITDLLGMAFSYQYSFIIMGMLLVSTYIVRMFGIDVSKLF
jgi:hypothetical protein